MSNVNSSFERFLQRWSQRKRATMHNTERAAKEPRNEGSAESPSGVPPTINPVSLPPIEAIGAATDVRAFLQPGVPAELTRAALRRAWASDPAIRDYIGIADNQWDFNKADGVPGFGPLKLTPDLERSVAELFGDFRSAVSSVRAEPGQMQSQEKIDETPASQGNPDRA